ncbi:heterokaryon incompatibility protein-domain-containing protein [Bisporella sp. PMI_857]|nr:heterokaryon incompatibility protein-domain-containing protein [Bisporella sp. PMI_857]
MFMTLPQAQNRSWLLPSCPSCPPDPSSPSKPSFHALKTSAEKGCERCNLFYSAIIEKLPQAARLPSVTWGFTYSVLTSYNERPEASEGSSDKNEKFELEFFIHPDSKKLFVDNPNIPTALHTGRPTPKHTYHEETIGQIRRWYTTCVNSHDQCRSEQTSFVPRRLLDIESPLCESEIRLVDTQQDFFDSDIQYVCLSHCWGKSRPRCITLIETLDQNREQILWNTIPKTFQNVISVLRKLGFRYLWIDSICIIQDDTGDWATEAAHMCDVYSQAALTVAATSSFDSHQGLHSSVSPEYQSQEFSMILMDGTTLPVWARKPIPHFPGSETHTNRWFEVAPLLQRGWVLQERLLSRRVVHFAANEVIWECLHFSDCQCLGGGTERFGNPKVELGAFLHGPRTEYKRERPGSEWYEIVQEYTKLALTFQKDRFPALSGAARRSRQFRNGDEYIAGIWKSETLFGLTWCASIPLSARRAEYVAPTWSWAAVDSAIWWPSLNLQIIKGFLNSVQTQVNLAGPDPTGRLKQATMIISGPAATGSLNWENVSAVLNQRFSIRVGSSFIKGCFWPDYLLDQMDVEHHIPHGSDVLCLLVLEALWPNKKQREYQGLVLSPSKSNPKAYERVGVLRIERVEEQVYIMDHAKEATLTLV